MPKFNQGVLTNKGKSLITDLIGNKGSAKFTRAVTSDKVYKQTELSALLTIDSVKQDHKVSSVTIQDNSRVIVDIPFDNADVKQDYYINTIGLYCQDTSGKELLYSVTTAVQPELIPAFDGSTQAGIDIQLITNVGNTQNITLTADPSAVLGQVDKQQLIDLIVQSQISTPIGSARNLNLGSLSNDDFPSFRAFLYQYGAGVAQPGDGYFGVKQTNEVPIQAQFTNANGTVQFLINNELVKKYCPDFNFNTISTTFSSDKKWIYLTSGVSTVGIRAENVTFK